MPNLPENFPITAAVLDDLVARACAVAARAYVPASGFQVGAALLAADGQVFTGCNVENSSFGLTVCAERNAVFHAVAEGCREFSLVVVHTPLTIPGSPCGACRQVLAEFGPALPVVLVGNGEQRVFTDLAELLPRPFRFDAAEADS